MKKYNKIQVITVILLLLPIITQAATVGNLTYSPGTRVITDNLTGVKYLGWDVLAGFTFAETETITQVGETYEGYHIATQTDAYAFFNGLTQGSFVDEIGINQTIPVGAPFDTYDPSVFGNTYDPDGISLSYFISDNAENALGILYINDNQLFLIESFNVPTRIDTFNIGENDPSTSGGLGVSLLLVSNVPIPSTVWLMGSGVLGLLSFFRKKKV